jgi:hypothetical protein
MIASVHIADIGTARAARLLLRPPNPIRPAGFATPRWHRLLHCAARQFPAPSPAE